MKRSYSPVQDHLSTQNGPMDVDVPGPASSGRVTSQITANTSRKSQSTPTQQHIETLSKRRKVSGPSMRVSVVGTKTTHDLSISKPAALRVSVLASFRRAASLRSEQEVADVLDEVFFISYIVSFHLLTPLYLCRMLGRRRPASPRAGHSRTRPHVLCFNPAASSTNASRS